MKGEEGERQNTVCDRTIGGEFEGGGGGLSH